MQSPKHLSKLETVSNLCFKTARTLLIIINLLTLVLACLFIYFSFNAFGQDYELDATLLEAPTDTSQQPRLVHTYVSVICAGLGFIVALLAVLGLAGAIRKSKSALGAYAIIVALTVIFLLAIALYTYGLSNSTAPSSSSSTYKEVDRSFVNSTVSVYQFTDSNDLRTRIIDHLQKSLSCCGVNSPSDWTEYSSSHKIPKSCCSDAAESTLPMFKYCANSDYDTGCWRALLSYFHSNLPIVRTILYFLVVFGLICTSMAAFMINILRNSLDVV